MDKKYNLLIICFTALLMSVSFVSCSTNVDNSDQSRRNLPTVFAGAWMEQVVDEHGNYDTFIMIGPNGVGYILCMKDNNQVEKIAKFSYIYNNDTFTMLYEGSTEAEVFNIVSVDDTQIVARRGSSVKTYTNVTSIYTLRELEEMWKNTKK